MNYRIGLDPLIGLVPGIGDAFGALLSMYIVIQGARGGLPLSIVLRMVLNVAVEALLGAIPIIGDLFDMTWKANSRNVRLIERFMTAPHRSSMASAILLWGIFIGLVFLVAALIYVGILILAVLWSALRDAVA